MEGIDQGRPHRMQYPYIEGVETRKTGHAPGPPQPFCCRMGRYNEGTVDSLAQDARVVTGRAKASKLPTRSRELPPLTCSAVVRGIEAHNL